MASVNDFLLVIGIFFASGLLAVAAAIGVGVGLFNAVQLVGHYIKNLATKFFITLVILLAISTILCLGSFVALFFPDGWLNKEVTDSVRVGSFVSILICAIVAAISTPFLDVGSNND